MRCKYRFEEYRCPYNAVEDGYCIFHHPKYWEKHPEKVREEFYKLIQKGETKFIGFNLPEIDLSKKIFKKTIYFNKAKFHNPAYFRGCKV